MMVWKMIFLFNQVFLLSSMLIFRGAIPTSLCISSPIYPQTTRGSLFSAQIGVYSTGGWTNLVSSHEKLKMKINNGNNLSMGTLPETNIAPENGWLEYYFPFLGWHIFRCYVSFRECKIKKHVKEGIYIEVWKTKIPYNSNITQPRC